MYLYASINVSIDARLTMLRAAEIFYLVFDLYYSSWSGKYMVLDDYAFC